MLFFDYLGGLLYWCYLATVNRLQGKHIPTIKDVQTGRNLHDEGDVVDLSAYFLKLKVIGLVVTVFICHMLTKIRF